MGKALVIKGTDFSAVSAKSLNFGVVNMMPINITGEGIDANGTITQTSGWEVAYVQMAKGFKYHLQVEWTTNHLFRVGTSATTPQNGSSLTMLVNDTTTGYPSGRKVLDFYYTAIEDGFFVWQNHISHSVSTSVTAQPL